MVADFVAKGSDLFDDGFVAWFWKYTKVVAAFDAQFVLNLCHVEGVGVAGFDVVTEDDEVVDLLICSLLHFDFAQCKIC